MDDPNRPPAPPPDAEPRPDAQTDAPPEPAYRWDATGADPPARSGRAMLAIAAAWMLWSIAAGIGR